MPDNQGVPNRYKIGTGTVRYSTVQERYRGGVYYDCTINNTVAYYWGAEVNNFGCRGE